MKKFICTATSLAFALMISASAFSQTAVNYSMTRTIIVLDVNARQEIFHAGPFAKYSTKYMGVPAKQEDDNIVELVSVKVNTALESDPAMKFNAVVSESAYQKFLSMTTQGLVSAAGSAAFVPGEWRFPVLSPSDFSDKGIPANLEYGSAKRTNSADVAAMMQDVVVEKSLEKKAKEVADRIFSIRENRYNILIGNTDATYSGEAMRAAVDELDKLEKNLMTLFFGYSEYRELKAMYEVIPDPNAKRQMYVAFRVSDSEGLVGSDNISGKPFFLELTPETEYVPFDFDSIKNKKSCIFYRVPAICKAVLSDGGAPVLQARIPICQLGQTEYCLITK